MEAENRTWRQQVEDVAVQRKALDERAEQVNAELAAAKQNVEATAAETLGLREELESLKTAHSELKEKYSVAHSKFTDAASTIKQLQEEIASLTSKLETAISEQKKLETERNSIRAEGSAEVTKLIALVAGLEKAGIDKQVELDAATKKLGAAEVSNNCVVIEVEGNEIKFLCRLLVISQTSSDRQEGDSCTHSRAPG